MKNTFIKEGYKLFNHFVLVFLVVLLFQDTATDAKRCMKNDDIGWRTGNVYTCNDPVLTECCERFKVFTCCEPNDQKHVREQIQLWGTVCICIILLAIVYLLLRRDVQVFSRPTLKSSIHTMKGHFPFRKSKTTSFSGVVSETADNNNIELSSMKKQNLNV